MSFWQIVLTVIWVLWTLSWLRRWFIKEDTFRQTWVWKMSAEQRVAIGRKRAWAVIYAYLLTELALNLAFVTKLWGVW